MSRLLDGLLGGSARLAKDGELQPQRATLNLLDVGDLLVDDPNNNQTTLDIGAIMGRSKPFVLAIAGVPLNGTVITGNFVTDPIKVGGGPFSASVRITGGGTGTFKIQWTDADIGAVTEDDWEDEANSTETGAARASWLAVAPPYNLARVVYTHGSGSRTMYGKATAKGS